MKLLIDDEIFIYQKYGGVSRVFTELIKRFKKNKEIELQFSCLYTENEYALNEHWNVLKPYFRNINFPGKGKILRNILMSYSHSDIIHKIKNTSEIQIFHPTFYSEYYLNNLTSKTKLVFTVHDLIHERFPDNALFRKQAFIKRKNIERADHIITVSENTLNDLMAFYPFVNRKNVSVIRLANPLSENAKKKEGLPEKYILFTGVRSGYKNFLTLLRSFSKIASKYNDISLVCTGGNAFLSSEITLIKELNLQNRIIQLNLTDPELKYVYEKALIFIFPSKYEGFGMPVLEAFASCTPCVLSNQPALREVGGEAALYFDPDNSDQLFEKIQSLIEDKQLRMELVEKGKIRSNLFSWDKCYNETLALYKSLIE